MANFRADFLAHYPEGPNKRMGVGDAERYWWMLDEAQQAKSIEAVKAYARWYAKNPPGKYSRKPLTWLADYGPDFEIDPAWKAEVKGEWRTHVVCGEIVREQVWWRKDGDRWTGPYRTKVEAEK